MNYNEHRNIIYKEDLLRRKRAAEARAWAGDQKLRELHKPAAQLQRELYEMASVEPMDLEAVEVKARLSGRRRTARGPDPHAAQRQQCGRLRV